MHLIRRFFGFVTAEPLTPAEQLGIRRLLPPVLARLFFAQRYEDQRHACEVQRRVEGHDLDQAALLHDVGKTPSDLGAVSRSLATMWGSIGFPVHGRWRQYLDHGEIGASMLESASADELAIAFTRLHPGPPPTGFDGEAWSALAAADDA